MTDESKPQLWVLIKDYGYDGTEFKGVFSTEEKARSAAFESPYNAVVLRCTLDEFVQEWEKFVV